jgi:hypothetical protein
MGEQLQTFREGQFWPSIERVTITASGQRVMEAQRSWKAAPRLDRPVAEGKTAVPWSGVCGG